MDPRQDREQAAEVITPRLGRKLDWLIWVLGCFVVLFGCFLTYVSYIGVVAVQENTRVLTKLGDLAVGNRRMMEAVTQDMQMAGERFKAINQQLTIIELQLDAKRANKGN